MGRPAKQCPKEADVASREWGHHIDGSVAQAHGEDLRLGGDTQQGTAQWQDGPAVGGGALGEDHNRPVRVFLHESRNIDQLSTRFRARRRRRKGTQDRLDQRDALHLPGIGVCGREDGIEDGGQIYGVNGRGKGRGNDRARLRETSLLLFGQRTVEENI